MNLKENKHDWDVFIAHSSVDEQIANELYCFLKKSRSRSPLRVFLASKSLKPGDDWDLEIPIAHRASKITVVVVTPRTKQAYYQRDEVAAAIAMAQEDPDRHRIVPIFLGDPGQLGYEMPYGLRLKQGPRISTIEELESEATWLDLVDQISTEASEVPTPESLESTSNQAQIVRRANIQIAVLLSTFVALLFLFYAIWLVPNDGLIDAERWLMVAEADIFGTDYKPPDRPQGQRRVEWVTARLLKCYAQVFGSEREQILELHLEEANADAKKIVNEIAKAIHSDDGLIAAIKGSKRSAVKY